VTAAPKTVAETGKGRTPWIIQARSTPTRLNRRARTAYGRTIFSAERTRRLAQRATACSRATALTDARTADDSAFDQVDSLDSDRLLSISARAAIWSGKLIDFARCPLDAFCGPDLGPPDCGICRMAAKALRIALGMGHRVRFTVMKPRCVRR
jgi:hypothetical protein